MQWFCWGAGKCWKCCLFNSFHMFFLRVKNRRWKMVVAPCEVFERGCNARGRLQVPRVPGHLELMAGGGDQTLNPRRQRFRAVELLADTF